jgi:hypothetical protein
LPPEQAPLEHSKLLLHAALIAFRVLLHTGVAGTVSQ